MSYNSKYAAELKKTEKQKKQSSVTRKEPESNSANPFSMVPQSGSVTAFGTDFFSNKPTPSATSKEMANAVDKEDEVSELADKFHEVLDLTKWESMPSHPPIYLATIEEVLDSTYAKPAPNSAVASFGDSGGFGPEIYENSLDTDLIFERFSKRVANEGEQCVRYELGGIPLAFQTDDVYHKLFTLKKPTSTVVTGAAFAVSTAPKRQYDISTLDRCSYCGKGRVFECQLMPYLINLLRTPSESDEARAANLTLEERRKEVERLVKGLKGGVRAEEMTGQEWGTCLLFTCEDDCCMEKNEQGEHWEARACWREEVVLVQWEM